MGWTKSICKVLHDGARRQSIHPPGPIRSSMGIVIEIRGACGVPKRSSRCSPQMESLGSYLGAESNGALSREVVALTSQQSRSFSRGMEACMISGPCSWTRTAGIHVGRIAEAVEPTYGVGPVMGTDRDPKTKGSTPDDFRTQDMHMAEPKEIAKEKAAIAQEEPPDFQVKKMMPEWEKPVHEEADSQRGPEDGVYEGDTRKLSGSARKEGDTTGFESEEQVEGPYGATPSEGTTRA